MIWLAIVQVVLAPAPKSPRLCVFPTKYEYRVQQPRLCTVA
jgi:hypothetical protein